MTQASLHPQGNMMLTNKFCISAVLVLICAVGLLAIWPLPGSIALRHGLLIAGFIASLWALRADKDLILSSSSWPLWLFLSFYIWLLIHLFFFSQDYLPQLQELSSLWVRCLLATPIGLALGLMLAQIDLHLHLSIKNVNKISLLESIKLPENLITPLLFIGFSGTCLIALAHYGVEVWRTHQLFHYDLLFTFYKAKPPFVICAALTLPLSFIFIIRALNRQLSSWWAVLGLISIPAILFCVYFSNTKNGVAIFSLTLGIFLINLLSKIRWTMGRFVIGLFILCFIFGVSYIGIEKHLKKNTAWSNLTADIKVGLDIDHQNFWKNQDVFPAPLNQNNVTVDAGTYVRSAWFIAGSRLVAENPLGYGLVHHSFGALALAKWPDFSKPVGNMRGATHSAWLDFALGVGIPGLLLVLIPLWVSWYRSLFQEGLWCSYASWTIPIMSFSYLTTETNGAHFTELLFFMTAFFCGLTLCVPVSKDRNSIKIET